MPLVNVDSDYPPTLLIHGTSDTDVPFEQSVLMTDALVRSSVEHDLIPIDSAEHGLAGGSEEQVTEAYFRALQFIQLHLPVGEE